MNSIEQDEAIKDLAGDLEKTRAQLLRLTLAMEAFMRRTMLLLPVEFEELRDELREESGI